MCVSAVVCIRVTGLWKYSEPIPLSDRHTSISDRSSEARINSLIAPSDRCGRTNGRNSCSLLQSCDLASHTCGGYPLSFALKLITRVELLRYVF